MVLNILTPIRFHFAGELPKAGKILGILAILVQTFSCTSVEFNNPTDPRINRGLSEEGSSSSEVVQSSSSEVAASSSSAATGSSSSVPNSSSAVSSSGEAASSSSVAASSSSSVPSSSSVLPSSSSVTTSSSSATSSSSSSVPSSSSVLPSSSSSVIVGTGSCDGFAEGTEREHYGKNKPQFCDERDGKKYVYVTIGAQTWMAENLNYAESGSKCGNDSSLSDANTATCDTYGRLYNWATAMALSSSCNSSSCAAQVQSKHMGVCPSGWHIPSDAEWDVLVKYVDPEWTSNNSGGNVAGTKLKATSGWNSNGNGTDEFGFAALPGGIGISGGNFSNAGYSGFWWSSSEINASNAYSRRMGYLYEYVFRDYHVKDGYLFSVRCLQDSAP